MKKFITNTVVFISIPIVIGIPILFAFDLYVNGLYNDDKIKGNISDIYIGDSHIKHAINDSIIPNSLNIAESSESFYFSYFKLKILLDNNPSIKKVHLGLSYHNLSNYYDRFISGDYSLATAPKYFYSLPIKEQFRMIFWNKKNLISFTKSIIKHGIKKIKNDKYSLFDRGFSNRFNGTKVDQSSMNKRLLFQFYKNDNLNSFSECNIKYLKKIIILCKSKSVELHVLNTPLHPYYNSKIPKEYTKKLNEIIRENQLHYIDLSNLKLKDECYIPDGDHVTKLGAEITSIKIIRK